MSFPFFKQTILAGSFLSLFMALPAVGQEEAWIVTDADVVPQLQSLSGAAGSPEIGAQSGPRVVTRLPLSLESGLQSAVHDTHGRCGGYTLHDSEEAALAEAANPFYDIAHLDRADLFSGTIDQQPQVLAALDLIDPSRITDTISWMEAMGTRHYRSAAGISAAPALRDRWGAYAPDRTDFSVELYEHPGWPQRSVVAFIRGTELPEDVVVLGAHLDSINPSDVADAPGADDDASGVATAGEVLRAILATGLRPRRSIAIIAYAAEEVGLRGSREIAAAWSADPDREVVAALQLDMTGFGGSAQDVYLITDYTSTALNDFLRALMVEYNGPGPHAISHGNTECGYACSDHAAWTGVGVPAVFPFEARFEDYNRAIHSPDDLLALLDTTGARQVRFAKLALEFALETAKVTAPDGTDGPTAAGFAWGDDARGTRTGPSATYAYNSSGGAVTSSRVSTGLYRMRFAGLGDGGPDRAPSHVQVTGYGGDSDCKVVNWAAGGADAIVTVLCLTPSGQPVDARYTLLFSRP